MCLFILLTYAIALSIANLCSLALDIEMPGCSLLTVAQLAVYDDIRNIDCGAVRLYSHYSQVLPTSNPMLPSKGSDGYDTDHC